MIVRALGSFACSIMIQTQKKVSRMKLLLDTERTTLPIVGGGAPFAGVHAVAPLAAYGGVAPLVVGSPAPGAGGQRGGPALFRNPPCPAYPSSTALFRVPPLTAPSQPFRFCPPAPQKNIFTPFAIRSHPFQSLSTPMS